MIVNIVFDRSVGAAPAGFRSAVERVAGLFADVFTDPVTINVAVGWGEVSGMTLLPSVLGEAWVARTGAYAYRDVVEALATKGDKSATDIAVVESLPAADPTKGGAFDLPRATAKVLGLLADERAYDGYVAFDSTPGTFTFDPNARAVPGLYDFVAVAMHELSHVMGRTHGLGAPDYTLMDLFRYDSPGERALTEGGPAYFSLDGGKTELGAFSVQPVGSSADWAASDEADAFRAAFSPGLSYDLSALDIAVMDALGWTVVGLDSAFRDDGYIVLADGRLNAVVSGGAFDGGDNAKFTDATLIEGARHGSVTLASDGSLSYEPKTGFSGLDSFTYQVMVDGTRPAVSQAFIHVVPSLPQSPDTLDFLALGAEEQIAAAYTAFFGRAPDAAGFEFWRDQHDRNELNRDAHDLWVGIASSFGVSQEARDLYSFVAQADRAGEAEIGAFLAEVYDNLFNRSPDAAGLDYWLGETQAALAAGEFVGSILVDILGGAKNTADCLDVATLMGKVIVGLHYVHQQEAHGTPWTGAGDMALAKQLIDEVTNGPQSVLVGIRNADAVFASHASA